MSLIDRTRAGAARFRDLHAAPDLILLPNAWDQASAVIIAEAGFPAIATTSAGVAFALGLPDGERMDRDAMLAAIRPIVARSPVPVTGDLEAGYGPAPEDVAASVEAAIGIGLVGANIEDADPHAKTLYDFDLSVARIRAGRAAADRLGVPFVLNARTDPYFVGTGDAEAKFRDAVRRANAYLEAGATSAFVPGPGDRDTIGRLAGAIRGPLNVLSGSVARAGMTLDEAKAAGVKRVSLGGSLMLACMGFARRALAELVETGRVTLDQGAVPHAEMNRLMATPPATG